LFTQYWRKWLYKIADVVLELPLGIIVAWPAEMHEPLLVALTLRFATVYPWQFRQSSAVLELGRQVQSLWRDQAQHDRPLLRQLCRLAASRPPWNACNAVWCGPCYVPDPNDRFYHHTPTDEDGFDWQPPSDLLRHRQGWHGDHLICPFQCDECWFRNLHHWDPIAGNDRDTLLLCCIRWVNLDALWGRESHMVDSTLRAAKQLVRLWKQVEPDFPSLGPHPVGDSVGFRVAIGMLLKSLEPGRYHKDHQQFETIRKL
jgi:hypothetical protein